MKIVVISCTLSEKVHIIPVRQRELKHMKSKGFPLHGTEAYRLTLINYLVA